MVFDWYMRVEFMVGVSVGSSFFMYLFGVYGDGRMVFMYGRGWNDVDWEVFVILV